MKKILILIWSAITVVVLSASFLRAQPYDYQKFVMSKGYKYEVIIRFEKGNRISGTFMLMKEKKN